MSKRLALATGAPRAGGSPGNVGGTGLEDYLGSTYRRVRRIGSGGMADVYEVEHVRLGARFAAKVLRPGRDGWDNAVRRFLREARLLARLSSDHIVRVVDVSGDTPENPFYIMELLQGQDLRGLIRTSAQLSVPRAVKIVGDACVGLGVAHAAGLVHRDLKPENLFITHRDSGEEICKLLDFGVSKGAGAPTTEAGALIGTVAYMAPEQIESAGTVTARADVYSLGAILYELLTGRPPHVADSVERLFFKILTTTPEPMANLRAGVPGELELAVERALSRDPASRFANGLELADALRSAGAPGESSPTTTLREESRQTAGRAPRPGRRWVAWLALGAAAGIAALTLRTGRPAASGAPVQSVEPTAVGARPAPADVGMIPGGHATVTATQQPVPASAPEPSDAGSARSQRAAVGSGSSPAKKFARKPLVEPAPDPAGQATSKAPSAAPLPRIRFELENPYGR